MTTNTEATVLAHMQNNKPRDARGWTYSTLENDLRAIGRADVAAAVDNLVAQGLLWKSGPRELGNVRRFRLIADAPQAVGEA